MSLIKIPTVGVDNEDPEVNIIDAELRTNNSDKYECDLCPNMSMQNKKIQTKIVQIAFLIRNMGRTKKTFKF